MTITKNPRPAAWLKTALRWMLLVDALAAALIALLTALTCPARLGWVVGMIVPECALWFALLPLCFAAGAWFLRRGHRAITGVTVVLCGVAFGLFLKPTVQAWQLGRALPAQLEVAFGPAQTPPSRRPFSIAAAIVPRAPGPVVVETIEYADSILLDFYRPIGRQSPAPCVIVIHGGSWVGGNRMDDGTTRPLNDHLARRGYAVASIDYRLAPAFTWPAQRDDLLAAIAFLRARAPALGIDPDRFVLLGRSAGGQMAPATAYVAHDPGIRGVIAIYPPTDFRRTWDVSTIPGNIDHRLNLEWFLGGTPDDAAAAYDSASATTLVTRAAPPTLILHGRLDINVFHEQAERLAERLAAARVPHALVSLPWAAHGFDLIGFDTPSGQITTYAVEHFVSAVTR